LLVHNEGASVLTRASFGPTRQGLVSWKGLIRWDKLPRSSSASTLNFRSVMKRLAQSDPAVLARDQQQQRQPQAAAEAHAAPHLGRSPSRSPRAVRPIPEWVHVPDAPPEPVVNRPDRRRDLYRHLGEVLEAAVNGLLASTSARGADLRGDLGPLLRAAEDAARGRHSAGRIKHKGEEFAMDPELWRLVRTAVMVLLDGLGLSEPTIDVLQGEVRWREEQAGVVQNEHTFDGVVRAEPEIFFWDYQLTTCATALPSLREKWHESAAKVIGGYEVLREIMPDCAGVLVTQIVLDADPPRLRHERLALSDLRAGIAPACLAGPRLPPFPPF